MRAADIVSAAANEPVIVFGSPPPDGRDLDLLVTASALKTLAAALEASGYIRHRKSWARFAHGSADVADLVPLSSWKLSEQAVQSLLRDARPIPGYPHLVRPAPHHALLVLARRLGQSGTLSPKLRTRVDGVLADDPQVWAAATEHAPGWRLQPQLAALQRAYAGEPAGLPRPRRGRRRRGGVVAISGLDGSGKSSQAEALCATLAAAGVDAVVEWRRLSQHSALDRIARPVKRVLRRVRGGTVATTPAPVAYSRTERDAASQLRQRSRTATWAWSIVVAVTHTSAQRRAVLPHLRADRVVICDRYVLDSLVNLRFRYGKFRLPALLIRLRTPRPLRAFYLDISPEESLRRKDDGYHLAQLQRQHELYAETLRRLHVVRVDGTRPFADITDELARAVWAALP